MTAPTIVGGQAAFNFTDASSQPSLGTALTSTVTSGNAVGGAVKFGTATSVFNNITDDKGNVYTINQSVNIGLNTYKTFSLGNITNAPKTISINFTGSTGVFPRLACYEVNGAGSGGSMINAFDANGQIAPGDATDAITTQSGTTATSVADCLLVGACWDYVNTGQSSSNQPADGTGCSGILSMQTPSNFFDTGRVSTKTQAVAGTAAITWTDAGGFGTVDAYASLLLAFAPPGGASPTTQSHGFVSG